jgi:DNA polymerase III subunit gamma/tau
VSYQVIARRWRPQSYQDVVSQEHILKTIRNALTSGRIHHAYLFTGPRGVGKTTVARILAKSLNCVNGPTPEPCGVCSNCVEIKAGNSFDVYEIDGASNTSVDNVRDLREKVNFAPVKSHYKIYIIDEVHMLSTGAFNALLKTLEEPPAHAIFIFATTELHKVPDTIVSRCQKFTFRTIPVPETVAHLARILAADGIEYEEKALYPIARASGGSMRDAQSLLEQLIAFSPGAVTEAAALESLGVVPFSAYVTILRAVAAAESSRIVDEVGRAAASGVNMPLFTAGLAELIRAARLVLRGIDLAKAVSFSADEMSQIRAIAGLFTDEELSAFFRILTQLLNDLRTAEDERISLEMALLDMELMRRTPSISRILMKLEHRDEKKKLIEPEASPVQGNTISTASGVPRSSESASVSSGSSVDDPLIKPFMDEMRLTKAYIYRRLVSAYRITVAGGVVSIVPVGDSNLLDARDTAFIQGWFAERRIPLLLNGAPGGRASEPAAIVRNAAVAESAPENSTPDDDIPLPEEEIPVEDYGVDAKPPAAVQRIVDFFRGEIVEKQKPLRVDKGFAESGSDTDEDME